jgi:hypothetical protein
MSVVSVVFCQEEVSATGRSPAQRSPTECIVDARARVCVSLLVFICNSSPLQIQPVDVKRSD